MTSNLSCQDVPALAANHDRLTAAYDFDMGRAFRAMDRVDTHLFVEAADQQNDRLRMIDRHLSEAQNHCADDVAPSVLPSLGHVL